MTDLVERLRKEGDYLHDGFDADILSEAADALEALQGENEKLREALEPFAAFGRLAEGRSPKTLVHGITSSDGDARLYISHFLAAIAALSQEGKGE